MSLNSNDYRPHKDDSGKPWVKDLAIFSAIISEVVGLPLLGLWMGRWLVGKVGIPANWAYFFAFTGFVIAIFRIRRYRKL